MSENKTQGTIVKALSGFYYVQSEGEYITCHARGKFRHQKITPLVGDRVQISHNADKSGTIEEIYPRKNTFQRPSIANIDQMILVCSGANPVSDPFVIDQMLSLVEGRGCEPLICINKWDLVQASGLRDLYQAAGFRVLCTSVVTGEGLAALRDLLCGKISAFSGNSGVGKSSLLNALDPALSIAVGQVSDKLGRGRHTTRHIELFPLAGGFLADTPGFAAFDAEKMEARMPQELAASFREFLPYFGQCRFLDCAHVKEQGCAVLTALAEGKIAESRHKSFVRLYEQAKARRIWK